MNYRILLFLLIIGLPAKAQVFLSDQALVHISDQAVVYIDQSELENHGELELNGELDLTGSFINYDVFKASSAKVSFFRIAGNWQNDGTMTAGLGKIIFNGNLQSISGLNSSIFYDLSLVGGFADIKSLLVDISVDHILDLGSTILDAKVQTIDLFDQTQAIQENGGFIHTSFGGQLRLNSASATLQGFPVPFGYNLGSPIIRNLSIRNPISGVYSMALIGDNPINYGMDPDQLSDSICRLPADHFWNLGSTVPGYFALELLASESVFRRISYWNAGIWQHWPESNVNHNVSFTHASTSIPANGDEMLSISSEKPFVQLEADKEVYRNIRYPIMVDAYRPVGSDLTWFPADQLTCSDCLNTEFNSERSEILTLRITNDICEAEDEIHINVIDQTGIPIQNAFTPTGDNLNEVFEPILSDLETLVNIRIFNRWGEILHDSPKAWDGTYKGQIVPEGTYVYEIEILREFNETNRQKVVLHGTVVILR